MTFPQIRYLLEIYRSGSVTLAAKKLFVSQSSVSIALSALEKELGYPIFQRTKKGLLPTANGIRVIEQASQIWQCHQQILTPASQKITYFRVSSATLAPVQEAFLQLVRENRNRQDISFSLHRESNPNQKLKSFLLEAAISMVLSPHLLSHLDASKKLGLETRVLCDIPCMIRIGKGHRLFHAEHINPTDLEKDLFLDTPNSTVSDALMNTGILQVNKNHSLCTLQQSLRRQAVLEGLAYEVVHVFPIQKQDENYRCIPLEGFHYKLTLTTNPLQAPLPELEQFTALLEDALRRAGV